MRSYLFSGLIGLFLGINSQHIPITLAGCELGCEESYDWAYKQPNKCLVWNDLQADEGRVFGDDGTWTLIGDDAIHLTVCDYSECAQSCPSSFNVPHEALSNGANQGCTSSGYYGNAVCLNP